MTASSACRSINSRSASPTPASADSWTHIAVEGSLGLAFADLQQALKRDRYDWASHWLMGLVHYQRGEHERARF
ncbi:hypothetical protein [Massilia genomosp. 1]|uniref:Uncharacterized protein n=1 Tax=Massilia genomosp. 1 TaxID=2609280 RepID=A0ABX0MWN4_9BURK|nr:hypothetical protein [Massilia genomosp. 1]NHZ64686.1 hypothetical protein [Massilia genomosp. 1]